MSAYAEQEPAGAQDKHDTRQFAIRGIRPRALSQRLAMEGVPLGEAHRILSDQSFREHVETVILREVNAARMLCRQACEIVRQPPRAANRNGERPGLAYTRQSSFNQEEPLHGVGYLWYGSHCYVVDHGLIATVRPLDEEQVRRIEACEGVYREPQAEESHLWLPWTASDQVPLSIRDFHRPIPYVPRWLNRPGADLTAFILDAERQELLTVRAIYWLTRMLKAQPEQLFIDPSLSANRIGELLRLRLGAVVIPTPPSPSVTWDSVSKRSLPEAVKGWWYRFCMLPLPKDGKMRLIATPESARLLLEIFQGSGTAAWRSSSLTLEPGSVLTLQWSNRSLPQVRWRRYDL